MAFLDETGLAELWGLIGDKHSQVATGSYTGTGTSGANNPNVLNFSFVPKYIAIFALGGDYGTTPVKTELMQGVYGVFRTNSLFSAAYYGVDNANTGVILEWGKTVSFYANNLGIQPNKSGVTYHYVAIG